MGGGTILILLLSLLMNLDQHIAQATNLVFFIPTAIAAIIVGIKNKNILWKQAIPIVISGIIGASIYSWYKMYIKEKIRHNKNNEMK